MLLVLVALSGCAANYQPLCTHDCDAGGDQNLSREVAP